MGRFRVAIDIHASVGHRSGIGVYSHHIRRAIEELAPGDMEIIPVGDREGPGPACSSLARIYWEQVTLPGLVESIAPDLLHLTGFAVPFRRSCPVLLTVHDLIGVKHPPRGAGARFYWSRYMPFTIKWADHIIAVSGTTRRELFGAGRVQPGKISVVYEAPAPWCRRPDGAARQRIAEKFSIADDYLLMVSAFDPRKGGLSVVRAVAAYNKRASRPLRLVLVGSDQGDRARVLSFVDSVGMGSCVTVPGYVEDDDLADLYGCCTCFLFASKEEGFGLPPLEAMACGAPVIAVRGSALPEILSDAPLWLDDMSDTEAAAEAIGRVALDSDLSRRLAEAGVRRAAAFSWRRAASETVDCYRRLLGRSEGG